MPAGRPGEGLLHVSQPAVRRRALEVAVGVVAREHEQVGRRQVRADQLQLVDGVDVEVHPAPVLFLVTIAGIGNRKTPTFSCFPTP